ncbi:MAG TPA: SH3 domain-containing protein [Methyloceanibacter sp.]|nr:SH3 domain-containing protein [Methyloceanibacter sp.]
MGLIRVSPPAIVLPRDLRAGRRGNGAEAAADPGRARRVEGPGARRPESLKLITACAENCLRSADALAASRVAQRFAPRIQAPPTGIRKLAVLLILATLLPNLTVAAFWLGLIAPSWTQPAIQTAGEVALPLAQPPAPLPVLSAPAALEAETGSAINFPIALDGTDGVPAGSAIVVKGLPEGARLSNGLAQGYAEWRLKPGEIGDLTLAVLEAASGEAALAIQLVAPDGRLVADTTTVLKVARATSLEPAIESLPAANSTVEQQIAALEGAAEETGALPEPVTEAETDLPPLPDKRPQPAASKDGQGDFVQPSAYVNLRGRPSSSGAVIGVVAKGAKLRVVERKRGWVRVTDPATSKTGWIYSGYLVTAR